MGASFLASGREMTRYLNPPPERKAAALSLC
jgi:hypothetical protein